MTNVIEKKCPVMIRGEPEDFRSKKVRGWNLKGTRVGRFGAPGLEMSSFSGLDDGLTPFDTPY
jgi:hypothetical protein